MSGVPAPSDESRVRGLHEVINHVSVGPHLWEAVYGEVTLIIGEAAVSWKGFIPSAPS